MGDDRIPRHKDEQPSHHFFKISRLQQPIARQQKRQRRLNVQLSNQSPYVWSDLFQMFLIMVKQLNV